MKKNLKIVFIIILIVVLLIPITYSYALSVVEPNLNEKQFFEISKTEVTKNEKVEMIINLDCIEYNEFIFELKSDEIIENVEIAQNDEIEAEKNNNEILMEINKAETNVKTINLYYSIPENKQVGDIIKFTATITSIINNEKEESELPTENDEIGKEETSKEDSEISTGTTELEVTDAIIDETEKIETEDNKENKTEIDEPKQETQSIELEIKIVEEENDNKQENDNSEPQIPSTEDNKQENNNPQIQIPNTENNKQEVENVQLPNKNNASTTTIQNIPTNYSNIQYNSMSNISINNNQVAKVTYNGSDNNYLSELSVEGYTFNRTFSKENTTYFITVEKEIEKIDIAAVVEDAEATACVYGNENLKEGINKILITVTAENGNVRNYRIYVTKNI